jgi:hypothetical protein
LKDFRRRVFSNDLRRAFQAARSQNPAWGGPAALGSKKQKLVNCRDYVEPSLTGSIKDPATLLFFEASAWPAFRTASRWPFFSPDPTGAELLYWPCGRKIIGLSS